LTKICFEEIKGVPGSGVKGSGVRKVYRFGPFRTDPEGNRLWDGDQPVPLTPKVFQLLTFLIENRDRVVSKKELLETIWPDCVVTEANVTQNVSTLRKALQEGELEHKFIATFPKKGYRFVADVVEETVEPDTEARPQQAVKPARRFRFGLWAALAAGVVAALGATLMLRRPDPLPVDAGVAITHLPGREYQPAISPDGNRVAFVHHPKSEIALRIGVVDLRTPTEPILLGLPDRDAVSPAWSPDSRRLAYLQVRENGVFVTLQEIGGEPVYLMQVPGRRDDLLERQLDWSPDGRYLAVSTQRSRDAPFSISLIHIAQRSITPLTAPDPITDGDFEPRFSPDGQRLAFLRIRSRRRMSAFVMELPAGVPYEVTGSEQPIGGLDWPPGSTSLVLSAVRDGVSRVWVVPAESDEPPWTPTSLITLYPVQISVSRTTGAMVTALAQPDENIWRAPLGEKGLLADWEPWIASTRNDWFPTFSPDSRRVVFLSDRYGKPQLWLKEPDGRERQLTTGDLDPNYGSWTADGSQIVFSSLARRQAFRIGVTSGSPTEIPIENGTGAHVAVTPDGTSVLLTRRFYLFQAPMTGGKTKLLTDQGGYPLRVSRDGECVYYARNRFSEQIWLLHRLSGKTEQVVDRLKAGCWACWSVNDRWLVYVMEGEAGRPARIMRMDLASRRSESLGDLPWRLPAFGRGALALAPDGNSLLAVVGEAGNGDILLAQHTPWK